MKLIKNTIYNLAGLGLPLLVAVFCIPVLIRELGDARFGLLTLIWAVVSYFGLFDLGLGRALTQSLAVAIAEKDEKRAGSLIATATVLMLVLGVFAGILMALLAPVGVGLIKSVPDRQEAINAVLWMSLAMPFIVLTSGFRGVLEARNEFGIINAIRLPMGLFTFIGPVLIVTYGPGSLDAIACVLSIGRIVACIFHAWYALNSLPDGYGKLMPKKYLLKPLGSSGGWLTVSNIISPLMGYADRFIIGGVLSAAVVSYYTTPQEIVMKLWILPGAITAVLFPTFAAHIVENNDQVKILFNKSLTWLFFIIFPITSFIAIFSHEIISAWISEDFARESAVLMQIFSIGILINCLSHIPYTLMQSANAARITASIHCFEFPFFMFLIWWMTLKYGVVGSAFAWLIRMVFDSVFMFCACWRQQKWKLKDISVMKILILLGFMAFNLLTSIIDSISMRALFFCISLAVILVLVYVKYNEELKGV